MSRILFSLMFMLLTVIAFAAPVSRETAAQAAQSWMSYTFPELSQTFQITNTEPVSSDATSPYVVSFSPEGYVLVSADDRIKPILAFSDLGSFPTHDLPAEIAWFVSKYQSNTALIIQDRSCSIHPDWNRLLQSDLPRRNADRDILPLITTFWNHTWPFNAGCPVAEQLPSGHVNGGCLSTAVAQILKYWSFPTHGVGSNSYNLSLFGTISADFANATYNYGSMPNSLTNTPDADISQLIFHSGVAMNMQYSLTGSGTDPTEALNALVDHFSYSNSATERYFQNTGQSMWENYLREDLNQNRPVLQYGVDSATSVAHAWLVDGFIEENYFHINWGWSNMFNGYYYMSDLSPGQYTFDSSLGGVFNIFPAAYVPAPLNLTAVVQNSDDVLLQWQPVTQITPTGFSVYRNNAFLTTINDPYAVSYRDENLVPGTYNYYLKTLSMFGISDPSEIVQVVVFAPAVTNYQNGFESYTDFAAIPFPWQNLDLDAASTVQVPGYDYPNEGNPGAFFTIRPQLMIPPNYDIVPHGGIRAAACFGAIGEPNDDWLITPLWNSGNTAQIRFWAKSQIGNYQLSQLKVGYNTNPVNPTQMTIVSGANPIAVPEVWTEYVFDLNGHYNQNMTVGFHCVSNNGFILLLDDITLATGTANDDHTGMVSNAMPRLQVYPNPSRGEVKLSFSKQLSAQAMISIFDAKGRRVRELRINPAGQDTAIHSWDGKDANGKALPAGIYLIQAISEAAVSTAKVLLIK
jgi:hypothetical protein